MCPGCANLCKGKKASRFSKMRIRKTTNNMILNVKSGKKFTVSAGKIGWK